MQEANKALFGSFYGSKTLHSSSKKDEQNSNGVEKKVETTTEKFAWGYQSVPTLYSVYQKVETTKWILKSLFTFSFYLFFECLDLNILP